MGRAALARVLLQARPILLLDEPFAALDSDLRHQMLDLVVQVAVQTDATVLMVTHDDRDAKRFASHLITVDHGVAQPPLST
jgi:thiamine transport system ATP-binding protein